MKIKLFVFVVTLSLLLSGMLVAVGGEAISGGDDEELAESKNEMPFEEQSLFEENNKGWSMTGYDLSTSYNYPFPSQSTKENPQFKEVFNATADGGILTGDITGNDELELVVTEGNDEIVIYDKDFNEINRISVTLPESDHGLGVSLLSDVNGDGSKEIFAHNSPPADGSSHLYEVYVYDEEGTILQTFSKDGGDGAMRSRAVIDIGNDGEKEVVIGAGSNYAGTPRGLSLYDFTTGEEIWHYAIGPYFSSNKLSIQEEEDGEYKFVLSGSQVNNGGSGSGLGGNTTTYDSESALIVIDENGYEKFTKTEDIKGKRNQLVDLNNDGQKNILCITKGDSYYPGTQRVSLMTLDDGNIIKEYTSDDETYSFSQGGVGDINDDGYDEVVITHENGSLTILNHELQSTLIKDFGGTPDVHALNDITGDGKLEMLMTLDNELNIVDYEGNIIENKTFDSRIGRVRISDINGDGVNEIFLLVDGNVRVLKLEGKEINDPSLELKIEEFGHENFIMGEKGEIDLTLKNQGDEVFESKKLEFKTTFLDVYSGKGANSFWVQYYGGELPLQEDNILIEIPNLDPGEQTTVEYSVELKKDTVPSLYFADTLEIKARSNGELVDDYRYDELKVRLSPDDETETTKTGAITALELLLKKNLPPGAVELTEVYVQKMSENVTGLITSIKEEGFEETAEEFLNLTYFIWPAINPQFTAELVRDAAVSYLESGLSVSRSLIWIYDTIAVALEENVPELAEPIQSIIPILLWIKCPVVPEVEDLETGNKLSPTVDEISDSRIEEIEDNDGWVLWLPENGEYELTLKGTGAGSVNFYRLTGQEEEIIVNDAEFNIEEGDLGRITMNPGDYSEIIEIDEDGDGEIDREVEMDSTPLSEFDPEDDEDGLGLLSNYWWLITLIVIVAVIAIGIAMARSRKKPPAQQPPQQQRFEQQPREPRERQPPPPEDES